MTMPLILYKSALCPRCAAAARALKRLAATDPTLRFEEVDILTSPLRAWRDGIRMIPTVKEGDRLLSGLFLSEKAIADFIRAGRK